MWRAVDSERVGISTQQYVSRIGMGFSASCDSVGRRKASEGKGFGRFRVLHAGASCEAMRSRYGFALGGGCFAAFLGKKRKQEFPCHLTHKPPSTKANKKRKLKINSWFSCRVQPNSVASTEKTDRARVALGFRVQSVSNSHLGRTRTQ